MSWHAEPVSPPPRCATGKSSACCRPPVRVSGQRRYPHSAVELISVILALQEVGFALREVRTLIAHRSMALVDWQESAQRKLTELDHRIARAQAARTAIAHALACSHDDILRCPNFASVIGAHLAGSSLEQAHAHLH